MIHTIEAIIDEKGKIHLAEPVKIEGVRRALLTILEEPPIEAFETAFLSESSLSTDWLKPEEERKHGHICSRISCIGSLPIF